MRIRPVLEIPGATGAAGNLFARGVRGHLLRDVPVCDEAEPVLEAGCHHLARADLDGGYIAAVIELAFLPPEFFTSAIVDFNCSLYSG